MLLRVFAAGVIAAIALPRLKRAYDDGSLKRGADSLRDQAGKLGGRLAEGRDALAEQLAPARELVAEKLGRRGLAPDQALANPSRRPKANPWPVDRRALPQG